VIIYLAFKRIVLSSASLFQMRVASTVTMMYQKAMTGLALRRVFLQVHRFVISNKQQLDTMNKRMLPNELLTVKNMNYYNK